MNRRKFLCAACVLAAAILASHVMAAPAAAPPAPAPVPKAAPSGPGAGPPAGPRPAGSPSAAPAAATTAAPSAAPGAAPAAPPVKKDAPGLWTLDVATGEAQLLLEWPSGDARASCHLRHVAAIGLPLEEQEAIRQAKGASAVWSAGNRVSLGSVGGPMRIVWQAPDKGPAPVFQGAAIQWTWDGRRLFVGAGREVLVLDVNGKARLLGSEGAAAPTHTPAPKPAPGPAPRTGAGKAGPGKAGPGGPAAKSGAGGAGGNPPAGQPAPGSQPAAPAALTLYTAHARWAGKSSSEIIVGSRDAELKLMDVDTAVVRPLAPFPPNLGGLNPRFEVSDDLKTVAYFLEGRGQSQGQGVWLWREGDAQPARIPTSGGLVEAGALAGNGKFVAAAAMIDMKRSASVWSTADGKVLWTTPEGESYRCFAFDPHGDRLCLAGDRELFVTPAAEKPARAVYEVPRGFLVRSLAWSADGKKVIFRLEAFAPVAARSTPAK